MPRYEILPISDIICDMPGRCNTGLVVGRLITPMLMKGVHLLTNEFHECHTLLNVYTISSSLQSSNQVGEVMDGFLRRVHRIHNPAKINVISKNLNMLPNPLDGMSNKEMMQEMVHTHNPQ